MIQLINDNEILQVSGGTLSPMNMAQMRTDCLGALRFSISSGTTFGAASGALIGSTFPLIGTAVGGFLGGAIGGLSSGAYTARYNSSCVSIRVSARR